MLGSLRSRAFSSALITVRATVLLGATLLLSSVSSGSTTAAAAAAAAAVALSCLSAQRACGHIAFKERSICVSRLRVISMNVYTSFADSVL
jgi:hypothetical protein